ncbi:MAG: capsule assembly Wzi family protein [Balneolaceae bacterium]
MSLFAAPYRACLFGFLLIIAVTVLSPSPLHAQVLPVGGLEEEQLRLQELLRGETNIGLTQRPVWRVEDGFFERGDESGPEVDPDSNVVTEEAPGSSRWWERPLPRMEHSLDLPVVGERYPVRWGLWNPTFQLTTNSSHPHGENNAAAWYGKGMTTEWFAGGYLVSDYLTLSLRPQLIWQQNNDFPAPRFVPRNPDGESWYTTEGIGDRLDAPFRFGPDPFWTLDPGHSSIRLHYGAFEVGYGTDPLWWGPAGRYPLTMSTNAPGFAHTFIGTRHPVSIPWVGDLHVRWVGGKPAHSEWYHPALSELSFDQLDRLGAGGSLDLSGSEFGYGEGVDRYLSGLHLTWTPTLLPDLSLGMIRMVHSPLPDGNRTWGDIRAVLDPFQLQRLRKTQGEDNDRQVRYAVNSIYARWIWPESRFEIFGEFMRDDYAWDWRDFLMEPHHSSGYSFGFRKLFPSSLARWVRVHTELTNLTASYLSLVRPQGYRYTNPAVPQGHTHRGKILGAAIGPGSNSQFLHVEALTDWGRVGVFFRREADNNQFHYEYDQSLGRDASWGDYKRHRTDLTVGLDGLWFIGPVALTGTASWTTMMNYGRFDYDHYGPEWGWESFTWNDLRNIHLQLGVQWLLK